MVNPGPITSLRLSHPNWDPSSHPSKQGRTRNAIPPLLLAFSAVPHRHAGGVCVYSLFLAEEGWTPPQQTQGGAMLLPHGNT